MIVDVWTQPALGVRLERETVPEGEKVFRRSGSPVDASTRIGPEELVGLMDKAGVDHFLLSAWRRPEGWVITNDEIAEFTEAFPESFSGVATVDLSDPVAAVAELRRAVEELGFVALRVVPWLWELPPDDRLYYPLYVACCELGIPFCTQVGHTGPLKPSDTGRPVPYLDRVALDFPELTIVGGHIGFPWTMEMIGLAWKHDRVYIDTSAYLPRYYPAELLHFLETYGRDKVLFGTNWPQFDLARVINSVEQLPLSPDARRAFLGENAARVFRLPLGADRGAEDPVAERAVAGA